ncbi:hypothetical protein B0T26DRAFT_690770 [Lasiosphaeria miniovina]|uniref:MYND-type domain-containing protein n=1 Tax=Lasiosphaeria miniovina TaxID=1954250 RepID=A0AA40ECL7_9PEZI|nr:uncharacterized protein B0T26DRAFT_690770 [Lasiosphaeria miniovina]KAK0735080.1 hypothetical protein B0T26DRAFT_690770 [Lasiosphaeria miniovina]
MSTSFSWGQSGLNKSRFEAYTKLLRLRNGGQVEESSDFSERPDDDIELTDPSDGTESLRVHNLSHVDNSRLKRAFLDRLSELVANSKGGHHVSAALMVEWPDRVDVLVARNSGFKPDDPSVRMLERLSSGLREISRIGLTDSKLHRSRAEKLWASLVDWYKPRLMDYIVQAKLALKKCNLDGLTADPPTSQATSPQVQTSPLPSKLRELYDTLNNTPRLSTKAGLEGVILLAYHICYLFPESEFKQITKDKSGIRSIRNALGFLGRLQSCFNTLINATERLSNFDGLRIVPVTIPPNKPQSKAPNNKWSAVETFASLNLRLDDQSVENVIGSGNAKGKDAWTKGRLLQKFDKLKSSVSEVHAEVQLVLGLAQHSHVGGAVLRYIGCSKRGCFLCSKFVHGYGSFTTPGSHGKLYHLWSVPEVSVISDSESAQLAAAVGSTEKAMRNLILNKKKDHLAHVAESTVGGSSVASTVRRFGDQHLMDLVSRHLESQREAAMTRSAATDDTESHLDHIIEEPLDSDFGRQDESAVLDPNHDSTAGECEICETETTRRCSFCNRGWFCTANCQEKMSTYHLAKCSARSLTTADILCRDAIADEMPSDPQTRDDFGFSRCRTWHEESHLLGMYRGMVALSDDVHAHEVHEWRVQGVLADKIDEFYLKIPERRRGSYYPWFARNKHLLDPSVPPVDTAGKDNPLLRAIELAKPYLDPADREKDFRDLEPPAKRYCFVFFAMALETSRPNPGWEELDMWYDFGFATCADEYDEGGLGSLYNRLVGGNKYFEDYNRSLGIAPDRKMPSQQPCPFSDFWRAWEVRSLPRLFDRYGLGGGAHLRHFLSFPADRPRPSVWRLRHMLALDDNTPLGGFPEIEAAAREYGFTAGLDARTKIELLQFYRKLLNRGDALEIHAAKTRGNLLEYSGKCLADIDERVKEVLKRLR